MFVNYDSTNVIFYCSAFLRQATCEKRLTLLCLCDRQFAANWLKAEVLCRIKRLVLAQVVCFCNFEMPKLPRQFVKDNIPPSTKEFTQQYNGYHRKELPVSQIHLEFEVRFCFAREAEDHTTQRNWSSLLTKLVKHRRRRQAIVPPGQHFYYNKLGKYLTCKVMQFFNFSIVKSMKYEVQEITCPTGHSFIAQVDKFSFTNEVSE